MHTSVCIMDTYTCIRLYVVQTMEANFADVLEEGESVDKFVQVTGKGRGMTVRSRDYVRPIAVRYVQVHCQYLLQLQTLRRETEPPPTTALVVSPAVTSSTTPAAAPFGALSTTAIATPATATTVNTCTSTSLTNDLFNDDDWDLELDGIEVQEIDETWRAVTLFRHKTNSGHVCIWFGGVEYEGMDPSHPYSYCSRTETLEDDEGYDINWRMIGVENHSSDEED